MVKIKSKRGWLKIVEAFIAILLIMGVLLMIYSTNKPKSEGLEIQKMVDYILREIGNDESLRNDILNYDIGTSIGFPNSIINFVRARLPDFIEFEVKICAVDDVCGLEEYKKEVYAKERIVSANLEIYSPRKLKIFVWEK